MGTRPKTTQNFERKIIKDNACNLDIGRLGWATFFRQVQRSSKNRNLHIFIDVRSCDEIFGTYIKSNWGSDMMGYHSA